MVKFNALRMGREREREREASTSPFLPRGRGRTQVVNVISS